MGSCGSKSSADDVASSAPASVPASTVFKSDLPICEPAVAVSGKKDDDSQSSHHVPVLHETYLVEEEPPQPPVSVGEVSVVVGSTPMVGQSRGAVDIPSNAKTEIDEAAPTVPEGESASPAICVPPTKPDTNMPALPADETPAAAPDSTVATISADEILAAGPAVSRDEAVPVPVPVPVAASVAEEGEELPQLSEQEEKEVLMRFYAEAGGDSWKKRTNWGCMEQALRSWHGVSVHPEDGSVNKIRLYGNNLTGA